ncbi:MAG: winged helix-turn-helix transcriptional regulator [Nanoarchaeota archaeon]|nr:winged helix-turn-helix transcriptional regulator [Nanoarchaeota archaeon]
MVKSGIKLIKLVGQPYVFDIISALKKPGRFSELRQACKNERTLSKKLNALRQNGLIGVTPVLIGGKYENHYKLTAKGEEFLRKLKSI